MLWCVILSPVPFSPSITYIHIHTQKIKDITPEVKQATDRESRDPPFRGRGRGRGGAGFAARNFSQAGLTRGGPRNSPNSDVAIPSAAAAGGDA